MSVSGSAPKRTQALMAVSCCALLACQNHAATTPALTGEPAGYTHIPPATRQAMLETAQDLFKASAGCRRVEQIEASVKNIRMMFSKKILNGKTLQPLPDGSFLLDEQPIPASGYVQENDEIWQVTGCKAQREFTVKYFGDDKGATYFGVFDSKKHPAPAE